MAIDRPISDRPRSRADLDQIASHKHNRSAYLSERMSRSGSIVTGMLLVAALLALALFTWLEAQTTTEQNPQASPHQPVRPVTQPSGG